ncbi:MAG: M48 family metallopeptidase [Prevotella sp.]|nr:M48 family metallopeptidase [Prevotella sp.]MDD3388310.1 M48 family metallopeptidase [Prevotella sp.]MDD4534131.1 M48 family metallopeptidase [Prevotella sp.]
MKNIKLLVMTAVASILMSACGTTSTVPITNRTHKLLVTDQQVLSLSTQQYNDFMKTATVSTSTTNTALVKRVGNKLATAVETFLKNNGLASEVQNFAWEFNLVKNTEPNAFCMPGGKIVVYEGLLPVTQNEASLAIVLGHEIAHAVAKHSAEQMSKQMRQQYGTQILGSVLNSTVGSNVGDIAGSIAQTGFSFANLKYSRDNEYEADHIGLIFAAMAGYDPQVAIPFWQRMSQSNSNGNDFFSSHPSDGNRITALQKEMPEALKYYEATKITTTKKK